MVGSEVVRDRLLNSAEPWKLNYLADQFCQTVLQDKAYYDQTEEWILTENKKLVHALNEIQDVEAYGSYANYVFLKYLGNANLKDSLLKKGIMIRTCDNYDGIELGYYRVAVKDSTSNQRLVNALIEICE